MNKNSLKCVHRRIGKFKQNSKTHGIFAPIGRGLLVVPNRGDKIVIICKFCLSMRYLACDFN